MVEYVWPRMLGTGLTKLQEGMGIFQHGSLWKIVLLGEFVIGSRLFSNGGQDIVVVHNRLTGYSA